MSLFRRNEIWYASYSLPGGKRIKESLGTKDKRQAQELHDKRKAELWRVEKLGDLPDVTFEEACLRWLEEKADKKSLDSDKSRIEFWLEHFEGIRLKDISEAKIYSAVSRTERRKKYGNRKFRPPSGRVKNCLFMNQSQYQLRQRQSILP